MSYSGIFENILRVGIIKSVDYEKQTCSFKMYDRIESTEWTSSLLHPLSGDSFGMFCNPEPGTLVLVGWGNREQPYIVSYLPNNSLSKDLSLARNTTNILTASTGYPVLESGEIALSGKDGNEICLKKDGRIDLSFGDSSYVFDANNRATLSVALNTKLSESSFSRSGVILRDLRTQSTKEEATEEKQISAAHFRYMSEISRDPYFLPSLLTSGLSKGYIEQIRNPSYTEERKIIREFSHEYMVGTLDQEKARGSEEENFDFLFQPNNRSETDYDVLNLNVSNPNLLMESVQGTLVDIYGNLLDLNRRVINFPSDAEGRKNINERLEKLSALNRRTVKIHYELNAKKTASGEVAVDTLDGPDIKNGHSHSRWAFDVDAEGLTKVNIPASSDVGNIPLLSRHVTENLRVKNSDIGLGLDEKRPIKDISHLAFGELAGEGVAIPKEYASSDLGGTGLLKYRTAFHDIINTAPKALMGTSVAGTPGQSPFTGSVEIVGDGSFSEASDAADQSLNASAQGPFALGASFKAIQASINNTILSGDSSNDGESPNAGGRSIHMNLDGSLELNIGRDTIDHKSIVIDTSGGIVSRIGRMREESNNASVISQLDGHVFIQVGGDAVEGEEPIEQPKVKFVVKSKNGTDEILIDENQLQVRSASGKNLVLLSEQDIILGAKGKILLAAATVGVHGDWDSSTGKITTGPSRLIKQTGKEI